MQCTPWRINAWTNATAFYVGPQAGQTFDCPVSVKGKSTMTTSPRQIIAYVRIFPDRTRGWDRRHRPRSWPVRREWRPGACSVHRHPRKGSSFVRTGLRRRERRLFAYAGLSGFHFRSGVNGPLLLFGQLDHDKLLFRHRTRLPLSTARGVGVRMCQAGSLPSPGSHSANQGELPEECRPSDLEREYPLQHQ